jgi:hypothetical protein
MKLTKDEIFSIIIGAALATCFLVSVLMARSCVIEEACMKACDSVNVTPQTVECIEACRK